MTPVEHPGASARARSGPAANVPQRVRRRGARQPRISAADGADYVAFVTASGSPWYAGVPDELVFAWPQVQWLLAALPAGLADIRRGVPSVVAGGVRARALLAHFDPRLSDGWPATPLVPGVDYPVPVWTPELAVLQAAADAAELAAAAAVGQAVGQPAARTGIPRSDARAARAVAAVAGAQARTARARFELAYWAPLADLEAFAGWGGLRGVPRPCAARDRL